MKKRKILIGCIVIAVLLSVSIVTYISSRLPDGFGIDKFTKGMIAVELKHEPFAEVSSGVFFFRSGNMESVIAHLENRSILFDDQLGALVRFTYAGDPVEATVQAITRWHSLLSIDDVKSLPLGEVTQRRAA